MRYSFSFLLATLVLTACTTSQPAADRPAERPAATAATSGPAPRVVRPLDDQWRFLVGDPAGAERPEFADTRWRTVSLPHDWSIEGPFAPTNPTGGAGAFLPSGVAWYRRTFSLPADSAGRDVFIQFDGVMQNSDVWINGIHLGHRPYGYVSFTYELTKHLRFGPGTTNVVAVRTDTSQQPASRWYSGAGIYRHVRLLITDPVHVRTWSTFVFTENVFTPPGDGAAAAGRRAELRAQTTLENESAFGRTVTVRFTVTDPAGRPVATKTSEPKSLEPGASREVWERLAIDTPQLWSTDSPHLYRLPLPVYAGAPRVAADTVTFGIRQAEFDSNRGFLLNGQPVKLLGVCLHHDGGAFGAAVPLAVWQQRLATLRTLGVNAIRTAHNPPDPGFLDLCDRMGFLVMDELFDCWTVGKNPYDYHLYFDAWSKTDVRDTVRRDRNHPSIVLYSAGNEIHDTPQEEKAKRILAGLVATFHEYDPSRPVTQALFRPNVSHDYTNGLADLLDVIGTNYRDQELLAAWRAKPGRKIIGTEQRHDRETWLALRDHPQEAGQFLWTGVDYLGESRAWPVIGSSSGLLDRTGAVKPTGRERQSWWSRQPMVSIARRVGRVPRLHYDPGYEPANAPTPVRHPQVLFADWNPTNPAPHEETVEVYSNCESVELFLNGKSLGAKPINADAAPRVWKVSYVPGTLRAIGRNGETDVARDDVTTAGAPARIVLTADEPGVSPRWDDVARVTATVVDANGVRVPTADNDVTITIDGPGVVVAMDNGSNATHQPFQTADYPAYEGRCVAFVRATATLGTITVHATAAGLAPGAVRLTAQPSPP